MGAPTREDVRTPRSGMTEGSNDSGPGCVKDVVALAALVLIAGAILVGLFW